MGKYQATGAHKIHSFFSASGGVLSFYRDNASTQLAFGESGTGLDIKFYGDTVSSWVLWDESADTLYGASSATLEWYGPVALTGAVQITGASTLIGDASTDKIGFFGTTPRVQLSHTATSAITSTIAINVLEGLQALGLMTATA